MKILRSDPNGFRGNTSNNNFSLNNNDGIMIPRLTILQYSVIIVNL